MTASELARKLDEMPPDAVVAFYDDVTEATSSYQRVNLVRFWETEGPGVVRLG